MGGGKGGQGFCRGSHLYVLSSGFMEGEGGDGPLLTAFILKHYTVAVVL